MHMRTERYFVDNDKQYEPCQSDADAIEISIPHLFL